MIEQHDDSITVTGRPLLGEVYRAVLSHIAHRRANGAPSDDLRQLAMALYRACVSPQRHEIASAADTPAGWSNQDGGLIDSAEAARLLAVSRRQAQRLASGLATRCGRVWLYRRAAVLELASPTTKAGIVTNMQGPTGYPRQWAPKPGCTDWVGVWGGSGTRNALSWWKNEIS
jgi:hypothetical protein